MQSHIPPTDYGSEEHGQPAPNDDRQVRFPDPVRAELARQGGEHLVELLTEWLAEYDEWLGASRLSSSYGWIANIVRHNGFWELRFEPADGTPALRLFVPMPEWWTAELLAEADRAHHSSADRVIVIRVLSPASEFGARGYDGELFGVCESSRPEVVIGPHLVTSRKNNDMGDEIVPALIDIPRVVDPSVVVHYDEAF